MVRLVNLAVPYPFCNFVLLSESLIWTSGIDYLEHLEAFEKVHFLEDGPKVAHIGSGPEAKPFSGPGYLLLSRLCDFPWGHSPSRLKTVISDHFSFSLDFTEPFSTQEVNFGANEFIDDLCPPCGYLGHISQLSGWKSHLSVAEMWQYDAFSEASCSDSRLDVPDGPLL